MSKYIFADGGDAQQQSSQFDYTDSSFLNSIVDNTIQQQHSQQQEQQPQQQDEDNSTTDDTTEFIKNLQGYDADQQQQDIKDQFSSLESHLTEKINSIQDQLDQQSWLSSDEGMQYMADLYDTQKDGNPMFAPTGSLANRQLMAESGGNDNALSPKGAMGAYQFMPSTFNEYKSSPTASPNNRADAQYAYNKYMGVLLNQFGNDQRKAVAAYNAGPTRVQKLINQYGDKWEQYLPQETKGYLKNVFGIQTKKGVDIQDVNNSLLGLVKGFTSSFPGIVVTSGTDGQHMANSAHYDGEAVDIGANSSTPQAYKAFKQSLPQLKRKYGIKYLDEGDHIHLSLSTHGKT